MTTVNTLQSQVPTYTAKYKKLQNSMDSRMRAKSAVGPDAANSLLKPCTHGYMTEWFAPLVFSPVQIKIKLRQVFPGLPWSREF